MTTSTDKMYWVGLDDNGIRVATLDIHDIKGLTQVWPVNAVDSNQAKVRYNAVVAEDAEGQRYFESFHP